MIEEAHQTAHTVLREHIDDLNRMADLLVERETIDKEQFERLLAGESARHVFADAAPPPGGEGKKPRSRKPTPLPSRSALSGLRAALSKPIPPERRHRSG